MADVIDPLGGSWFVEEYTDRMDAAISELLSQIEALGDGSMLDGVLRGIEDGWFQSKISDSAYEFEKALGNGDRVVVGVTDFIKPDEPPIEILRIGSEIEEAQRRRLAELRARRNDVAVVAALDRVETAARSDENLMPALIDASRVRATEGEIIARLKDVFGVYREPARI